MFVSSLVDLFVLLYNFMQSITLSTDFSDTPDQFSLRSQGTLGISIVHIHSFSLFLLLYTQTQIYTNTMRYELHGNIPTSSCSSLYFQNLVPRMFQCIFPLFMMANLGSQLDTLSRRGIAASGLDYEQVCVGILLTAD